MEQRFSREISSLEQIFEFANRFAASNSLDESVSYVINFVIEEMFTNMVKYQPNNKNDILIGLLKEGNTVTITLTDFDVEPFDPTKLEEVDVRQALQERKVGGLGIHLVKKMVDTVEYEYKDRQGRITLTKRLEK
jgi:serine/threonine-protein kinase RsbW